MTPERVAAIGFCIVITSSVATGQQRSETTGQTPARSVIERAYAAGDLAPWRRVQTRSESGAREVVVETSEVPDVEGRWAPIRETVRETMRETLANGDASAVHNTWVLDVNGRRVLTSRQIEQARLTAPDVRQTDTTLLVPSLNETLREAERTESTERRIDPGMARHDSTYLVRDINGRWQPIELRRVEAREIGAFQRVEEETIQRLDINGKLAVDERHVISRSNANGQDLVVIETYAPYADGFLRTDNRAALSQRVRRMTAATTDGGRYTVEEVEGLSPVAPDDPLRMIRRTVTTVRQIGTDRWVTERQVFERDVNGRMRLVINDTEERAGG